MDNRAFSFKFGGFRFSKQPLTNLLNLARVAPKRTEKRDMFPVHRDLRCSDSGRKRITDGSDNTDTDRRFLMFIW